MIDLASALVTPLAKLFLKSCLGDVPAEIGDNLLKLGFQRFGDWSKSREAKQLAERTAAGVVASLEQFFTSERVDPNRLEVAATDLGTTVGDHVDAAFLVHQRLSAEAIEAGLLTARPLDRIYLRHEPERDLYVRLIRALAPRLREIASKLPLYTEERDAEFFASLAALANDTSKILAEIAAIKPVVRETAAGVQELVERPRLLAEGYETDYLEALCTELNRVEIIGLSVDAPALRGELEVAYLPLRTRLGIQGETRQADFATLMTLLPELGNRILIEGPAGAGKSTLLRWAAIQAAQYRLKRSADDPLAIVPDLDSWLALFLAGDDRSRGRHSALQEAASSFQSRPPAVAGQTDDRSGPSKLLRMHLSEACWRTRVPFFVPLRRSGQAIDLDKLPKLILGTIEEPPAGWTSVVVRSALLLIDGVDEVPSGPARQAALSTIQTWAKRFPAAQMVVTSRPGAVREGALTDFTHVRLDELDEPQRRRFVDHWHRALGRQLGWPEGHPLLGGLAEGVRLEFERQRALEDLAANPLLCASLCALHWDRRREAARAAFKNKEPLELGTTVLPATRWRICDALTEMLLERREREQSDFYIKEFPQEYRLAYEQKATILSEIAWAMVEDDMRSTITRRNAEAAVRRALRSRRDRLKAKVPAILTALIERSGLLRGAGEDEVEFAHNTLKAFLAARHYLNAGLATTLARKLVYADLEELRSGLDEVAVFCAASPTGQRFATSLIDKLSSGAKELASRDEVERARWLRMLALRCEMAAERLGARKRKLIQDLAVEVFPPRNMDEARQLAALGEEAIARLAPTDGASDEEAAAAVRCLRLIGGREADKAINAYCDLVAPSVLEELAQVRHPLTLPAVVAASQDEAVWDQIPYTVKERILDVKPLAGLAHLRRLYLASTQVADLSPLADLVDLQSVDLSFTQVVNLSPLTGLSNLVQLSLDGTPITDVSPITGLTSLQTLGLSDTHVANLSPLADHTNLQTLELSATQVADLSPLAALINLEELNLTKAIQFADLTPLQSLSNLRVLWLGGTRVASFAPLESLSDLLVLALWETEVQDLSALTGLINLRRLYAQRTQVADLSPLADLSAMEALALGDTQVVDLTPLAGLNSLEILDLSGTQVKEFRPLKHLTNLQGLHLRGTQVVDLTPLKDLTNLEELSLYGTHVTDVSPLAAIRKLRVLDLTNTRVRYLDCLQCLTSLERIYLAQAPVSDEQMARLQQALPNLEISMGQWHWYM